MITPARIWTVTTVAMAVCLGTATAATAGTDTFDVHTTETVAPGVEYSAFTAQTSHGSAKAHLLTIDMTSPDVRLGTLYPGSVADTGVTTSLADRVEAVGGVNGDFFNIGETGASVGPMVIDGKDYKAGVPGAQRHGPTPPPGMTNHHVFAVTGAGDPVIDELTVDGKASGPDGGFALQGLNQYAITVDGVGVFNSDWGAMSRQRAVCGTDDDRDAPCSERTREVEVTDGLVTAVSDTPGEGEIGEGQQILLARDEGVSHLEGLSEGDEVAVDYRLASGTGATLETAIGAMPIIVDGSHLELDDDAGTLAPRTAAGASADGDTVYMLTLDGRSSSSVGATLQSLADVMSEVGAHEAVNFDGGGSTTLVARKEGNTATSVRNSPSDGQQRSVPNGLGVFSG